MKSNHSQFLCFFLALLTCFVAQTTHAGKPTSQISPNPSFTALESAGAGQPLDSLIQSLEKGHQSKTARRVGLAYELYQKAQFDRAIQDVRFITRPPSRLRPSDPYLDYGQWIQFQAYRAKAQRAIEQKHYLQVHHLAELAIQSYLKIMETSPMSPLTRNSSKDLASVELVIADANWGLQHLNLAQSYYEKAFFRLHSQNSLISVQPASFAHYASICRKDPQTTCITWLNKVKASFAAQSREVAAILQEFPEISDQPKIKSFRSRKLTMSYRSPDLDQTAFIAALQLSFEKRFSKAVQAWDQFLNDYPASNLRIRAKYWLGQSLELDQQTEKAKKIFVNLQNEAPLTYYGLLASFKTAQPLNQQIQVEIPLAADHDSSLQPSESFHLKRAQELISAKAYELASLELRELKPRDGLSSEFLLYLGALNSIAQNTATGLQIFTDLGQRGFNGIRTSFGLRAIFPKKHFDLIQKYSVLVQLDPILVLSLIKQESAFDENAGSSVGALGLMQLMPTTALETESNLPIHRLHQAEDNIRVGTTYLKKLLDRYQGNIALALAAYNAGPNAVDRWTKNAGLDTTLNEFIESIPYKETREYVSAIIRNYYWYTYQTSGDRLTNLDRFWKVLPAPKPQNGSA
jgi:soluble lytic murein transglycosylase-like protein